MCTDGKNIQKLLKNESEIKKSTQTPLKENQSCFEDDDEDEEDQDLKSYNNKGTGLEMTRSSCADDILMKTLVAKYANRLMGKLEKIALKVPPNSNPADAVVRLRRRIQRLLKDIDQVGGPCDSSTVLLNKYDCLRMAYYTIADGIKGTTRLPSGQGLLNNRKNCDKIKKCKVTDNSKKLDHQEKRINCENHYKLEKLQNCENEKLENLMKFDNLQERLDNCRTPDKQENCENNKKPENQEIFQAGEKFKNLENRLFNCKYCGMGTKLCDMTCDSKIHPHKDNCQKNVFEWKSFFKRRFFIYFPCVCCMCDKFV
ncbi:unnamed protein product [Macrosiphum euphorbiae]|uniref:Uncharacterized protein n=1 Tax=Macrosiphum euphorbiae TaxID=13131 RepID=A0AAV0WE05_9HEMI|nr:unnamed protein product [Macrosiphum euphorbiae]